MINRTRITVDQATRDVLDQLEAKMAQKPTWVDELHHGQDDLRDETRKTLRDGFAQAARQSETALTAASRASQTQLNEQATRLDALTEAVQALGQQLAKQQTLLIRLQDLTAEKLERLDTGQGQIDTAVTLARQDLKVMTQLVDPIAKQIGGLGTHASRQGEQLELLQNNVQQTIDQADRQLQALDSARQHREQILQISEKASSTSQRQLESVALLTQQAQRIEQQQQAFGQELLQALKAGQVVWDGMCAEQLRLHDALQHLNREVNAISRPWWHRIFARNSK